MTGDGNPSHSSAQTAGEETQKSRSWTLEKKIFLILKRTWIIPQTPPNYHLDLPEYRLNKITNDYAHTPLAHAQN